MSTYPSLKCKACCNIEAYCKAHSSIVIYSSITDSAKLNADVGVGMKSIKNRIAEILQQHAALAFT